MRNALLLGSLLAPVHAINLVQPRGAPKVVKHEIRRREDVASPLAHDRARLNKRASSDTVSVSLANEETLYYMDVSVGTPAQQLKLHIDTGSSDLWVNVPSSRLCSESGGPCSSAGTYNKKQSSTYKYVNSDFNITYVDGSGAVGDYVTDTVAFADVTLKQQELGLGLSSSSRQGIIGIGYRTNEASVEFDHGITYANVPASLVSAGYISTNAYSLYLNDLDASTGSILFGGVDTDKYTGNLQTVPILPLEGSVYSEFYIALTGVGANGNSGSIADNIAIPALLDSGTSLMYLPDQIAQSIFDSLNAEYDSSQGIAQVNCDLRNSDNTIDFTFSSPTISVPLNELVLVDGGTNFNPVCILGISPSGGSQAVLGDTFLRSAYVVYDLDSNEISLAQTDFGSSSSNVKEISSGSNGVPGATEVSNPTTSVAALGSSIPVNAQTITQDGAAAGIAYPTAAPLLPVLGAMGVGALFAL